MATLITLAKANTVMRGFELFCGAESSSSAEAGKLAMRDDMA